MEDNNKKNVYVTLHKDFVRTGIEYADRATGETRTFNSVTLPKGTVIDGVDVSYYQFTPLFVNPSRFKGENFRDIPLLADKEVWLKKDALDAEGNPVLDEVSRSRTSSRSCQHSSRRRSTRAARPTSPRSTTRPRTPARRRPTRPARLATPSR